MTDPWDELWENATIVDTDPDSWLGKIKIVGDKLKEKAILYEASHPLERRKFFTERHVLIGLQAVREDWREKAENWDQLRSAVIQKSKDGITFESINILKAVKAVDKLESFKAHLDAVFKEKSILDKWTWSINPISFDKLMANLYKVLEGARAQ